MTDYKIVVEEISKNYQEGDKHNKMEALNHTSFQVKKGEFFCILGPSGCGKSTLLNIMAGFIKPTTGRVLIDNQEVKKPSPKYVTVFQEYGLFPWRTVLGNVSFGLEIAGIDKRFREKIAMSYIDFVNLHDFASNYPSELSGGMQQRAALARVLAVCPEVIFMDEPINALDEISRISLQNEIARIWQEQGLTIIFVTHDIEEAIYLADRIAIMRPHPGSIERIIDIDMERPRVRTSKEFSRTKDIVIKHIIDVYP